MTHKLFTPIIASKKEYPRILVFVRYYLPGYKSGGPIRTISNLVNHLGSVISFRIVTSDRDAMDSMPYSNIHQNKWNQVGKASVYYASNNISLRAFAKLIRTNAHDVIYLNSFFSPVFTVLPLLLRRFNLIPKRSVIIAPRGEFSRGALKIKRWKKIPFLFLTKIFYLYHDLIWQASNEFEAEDIRRVMGSIAKKIVIASNLPPYINGLDMRNIVVNKKDSGVINIVFLSRIAPMKNLDFALRVLASVTVPVIFNIHGPIRDEKYWSNCQSLFAKLPSNIKVQYKGVVEHDKVSEILAAHDLFFLPTRGENYGHVILEAMTAGTPILISNATPWKNLEQYGVGWDLPLDSLDEFACKIHEVFQLSINDYQLMRDRTMTYARESMADSELIAANFDLFQEAIPVNRQ